MPIHGGARIPFPIALTFDDGPGPHTFRLLRILDGVRGHATFFAVGQRVDEFPDQARAVVRQGSDLWGHGWDHRSLVGMPAEEASAQITRTRDLIERVTGVAPPAFRPPYGDVDTALTVRAAALGQAIIVWSLDSGDWRHGDEMTTVRTVLNAACPGAIVLCHESVDSTVSAMARAIPALAARGFQLVTVARLQRLEGQTPSPGRIYPGRGTAVGGWRPDQPIHQ